MRIPLELRHIIFEHATAGDTKPKNLFRHWFEKKEVEALVAHELATNPTGPTPIIVYPDYNEPDSDDELEGSGKEEDSENDSEEEDEDNEDEDDDMDEDELDDIEDDEDVIDNNDMDDDDELVDNIADDNQAVGHSQLPTMLNVQSAIATGDNMDVDSEEEQEQEQATVVQTADKAEAGTGPVVPAQIGDDSWTFDHHETDDDPITHDNEDEYLPNENYTTGNNDTTSVDGDATVVSGGSTIQAPPAPLAPPVQAPIPAPVVRPHHKWQHIPKFMRITHCPPPMGLLLTSKELSAQALTWFYDVAILRINATGSFAHTTMFEVSLTQITDAAFSPMENIRKIEIQFAWDSEWLRGTDGVWPELFEAMLRLRAMHVVSILHRAPHLQDILIIWHDSIMDNESTALKLEIIDMFDSLAANIKVEEYFLTPGEKPRRRSVQGRRRLEFQSILDGGMNFS